MEEMEEEALFGIELNEDSIGHLRETAKWANFLAILGIIVLSLMVLGGIFMTLIATAALPIGGIFMFFIYLVFAAVYAVPIYYLYKFAQTTRYALNNLNSFQLAEALGYLKSTFKFMGILAIAMLCLYALIFMFSGLIGTLFL
jgi:hypothetical protein